MSRNTDRLDVFRGDRGRRGTDVERYLRGCNGKIGYPSKRHARSVIRKIEERDGKTSIEAYRCRAKSCGRWHLGHTKRIFSPRED